MSHVITLTGPSGAGKSTTVRKLLERKRSGFKPRLVPKYTTRPPRDDDHGEVKCRETIPERCDLVYEHCENHYGLESKQLSTAITDGSSPIVILNDLQMVKDVHDLLNNAVKSIFIFREGPSLERYRELAKNRGVTDEQEPVQRFLQARAFYHIYSENIHIFDHVILNVGSFADLDIQVEQFIQGLKQESSQPLPTKDGTPFAQRLFVIVGTPGSGKDWLIQAVNDLGTHQAQIVPKHTSRERRRNDRNEMICPGDPIYNLDACDIQYENYGDMYGIDSSRIDQGLSREIFQVAVVSNVDAIKQLNGMFSNLMVLVYIHSEVDVEEYRRAEIQHGNNTEYVERRAERYQLAFDIYRKNFLSFDHVLINSGDPEDLLDQMFRLFRAYERGDLSYTTAKPIASDRVWTIMEPGTQPKIIE